MRFAEDTAEPRKRFEPPAIFVCGETDVLKNGKLPAFPASKLPGPIELRSWTRDCQLAYWEQRRRYWNKQKLSILQAACRKYGAASNLASSGVARA